MIRGLLYAGMTRAAIDERGFGALRRILAAHTDLTVVDYVGMGHWISEAEATDVCAFVTAVLSGSRPDA